MSRLLIFETERLRLSPVTSRDAAETAAIMSPPVSRMLTTWPEHMSHEEAEARIAESMAETREELWTDWAIRPKTTGALAGWIGLGRKTIADRRLTVGIWFGEDYQGRGYGGEAVAAILAHAREAAASAVEATIDRTNARSIRLFERLGFRAIGERENYSPVRHCAVPSWAYEFGLEVAGEAQECVVGTI